MTPPTVCVLGFLVGASAPVFAAMSFAVSLVGALAVFVSVAVGAPPVAVTFDGSDDFGAGCPATAVGFGATLPPVAVNLGGAPLSAGCPDTAVGFGALPVAVAVAGA